jgi:hypothetical protein
MTTIKRRDLVQSVADGSSLHATGPAEWSRRIVELKLPVNSA